MKQSEGISGHAASHRILLSILFAITALPLLVIGFIAVGVTLPVAIHCFVAYGVVLTDPRIMIHSIAGCVLYGAFVAKVLLVQSKKLPGWALPVAGGLLALLIALLWYTSALWYYNGYQVPI